MSESLLARAVREVGGIAAFVDRFGPKRASELANSWRAIARPEQLMPGTRDAWSPREGWRLWLLLAGRGFGKTRTGAEAVTELVDEGRARSIALIAPTYTAARRLMIENPFSGLVARSSPQNRPTFNKVDGEVRWPNGAIGYVFTSEKPDGVRGFNGDLAWLEEVGSWRHAAETWSNLQLGLRVRGPKGDRARAVATTTPRPTQLLRDLIADPETVLTGGTTYDNIANLDDSAIRTLLKLYEGTRLGRQELFAELLGDTPGALWTIAMLDALRVKKAPELKRVVVAIDPATKDPETARLEPEYDPGSEQGIVVAGVGECWCKGSPALHGFVLEDGSDILSPKEWAERAAGLYGAHHADRIVAEINQGGALVESNLRTLGRSDISYRGVSASRGKQTRAEPVASLYERGEVHHVGSFGKLEDQMTTWQPLRSRKSPDRMDALVWALTDLMLPETPDIHFKPRAAGTRRY